MWSFISKRGFVSSTKCLSTKNSTEVSSKLTQTVYISQLSYDVTKEDIQKLFERYGPIEEIHLPMTTGRKHIKGNGRLIFSDAKNARRAAVQMQSYVMKNMPIKLTLGTEFQQRRKSEYDVLMLKNLPYNITEEDLLKIFRSYQVLRIGLPKSPIKDQCLGYGYARFASLEAANKAIKELNNVEVHGRNIRIYYAEPKDHQYKFIV